MRTGIINLCPLLFQKEKSMHLDNITVRMTIRKIIKKQSSFGTVLYDIYVTVPSCHPTFNKVKESKVIGPIACCTSKHSIQTEEGCKPIKQVKVGDILILELHSMIG